MTVLEIITLLNGLLDTAAKAGSLLSTLQTEGNRDATPAEWQALQDADAASRVALVSAIAAARRLVPPKAVP